VENKFSRINADPVGRALVKIREVMSFHGWGAKVGFGDGVFRRLDPREIAEKTGEPLGND